MRRQLNQANEKLQIDRLDYVMYENKFIRLIVYASEYGLVCLL